MPKLLAHYSAHDIESRILAAFGAAGMNPDQRISPEELGAFDHFHTGGPRATHELMAVANIGPNDAALDIGAGLAGSARLLASTIGCQVKCLEMSADDCIGARPLNRITGLEEQICVHEGCALALCKPSSAGAVE